VTYDFFLKKNEKFSLPIKPKYGCSRLKHLEFAVNCLGSNNNMNGNALNKNALSPGSRHFKLELNIVSDIYQ
jgi:hypothetical protein